MFADGNWELELELDANGPCSGESRFMFLGTISSSISLTPKKKCDLTKLRVY